MNKKPASSRSKHNGISASEFQRNLYNWFEEHGVLADLRAHLRHQMVLALRQTSLGPRPSSRSFSPKIQAINLLIAEFLLQQEHHYTLSVFTSEVPLLRNLPEFRASDTELTEGRQLGRESVPHFQQQDVRDILETLGLGVGTQEGTAILQEYQNGSEPKALIMCILQNLGHRTRDVHDESLPEYSRSNVDHQRGTVQQETRTPVTVSATAEVQKYREELQEIKHQSFMKSQHIKQLQEQIRRFQETEVKRVQAEEEAKFQQRLEEKEAAIQREMSRREQDLNRKLLEAEERLAQQQLNLERDVKEKRKHLARLAAQLHRQKEELKHRCEQAEKKEESLKSQEATLEQTKQEESLKLAEKNSQLEIRQQQLNQEFQRLNTEREAMGFMQQELEQRRQQIVEASHSLEESQSEVRFLRGLQQQCVHLREELEATRIELDRVSQQNIPPSVEMLDKSLQTQFSQASEESTSQEKVEEVPSRNELMELLRQLQRENEELRGHTEQQRFRIDELTNHAAHLARRLEDAEIAVTVLSGQASTSTDVAFQAPAVTSASSISTPPAPACPPPPPPLPAFNPELSTRTMQSQQMGAGELSNFDPSSVSVQRPIPTAVIVTIAAAASTQTPVSSQFTRPHSRREWRRKPPRRTSLVYHNGSSSEETSPTEQILEEARQRLRRLEEESEAVDRSYREFRARHARTLTASASLLYPTDSFALLSPPHRPYRPYLFSSSSLEARTVPYSHLGRISSSRTWDAEAHSYSAAGQNSTRTTTSYTASIVSSRVTPSTRISRTDDSSFGSFLKERQSHLRTNFSRSMLDDRSTTPRRHVPEPQQTPSKSVSFRTPLRTTSVYDRPKVPSSSSESTNGGLQKHTSLRGTSVTAVRDESHSSADTASTAATVASEFVPQESHSSSSRLLTFSTSHSTGVSDDLARKDISLPSLDLSSFHSHSDDNLHHVTLRREDEPKRTSPLNKPPEPEFIFVSESKNNRKNASSGSESSWGLEQNEVKERGITKAPATLSVTSDALKKTSQESSDIPQKGQNQTREKAESESTMIKEPSGIDVTTLTGDRLNLTAATTTTESEIKHTTSDIAIDELAGSDYKQHSEVVKDKNVEEAEKSIASEEHEQLDDFRNNSNLLSKVTGAAEFEKVVRVTNLDAEEMKKPAVEPLYMLPSVSTDKEGKVDEDVFSGSQHSISVPESGGSSDHPISVGKASRGSSDVDKDDFW